MRILHYSDLENAYDDPERIGRVAGLLSDRSGAETIVAGTGDNTGPGVLSLVEDGRQALDFFDAVEPAVETFGNHDFDHGYDELRSIISDSPQTWVSANVWRDGERFGADYGVVPWTLLRRGDLRVGVTAATTTTTPSITPTAADLRVTDPVEAVGSTVEEARSAGADIVIVLAHLSDDEAIARACDVDVVLGGHVNAERVDRIDGTVLTRPPPNGAAVYELTIDTETVPSVTRHAIDEAPIDETVAATLRSRKRDADLDSVIDTVGRPIERTTETIFQGESRIGNFVADAYRWATGSDVGLQNSGGIRIGPPLEDTVTVADLIGIVPFEEPIVVLELTGRELQNVCREASGRQVDLGAPDRWNAHISGAELVWNNATRTLEKLVVGRQPVEPDATYTLATSDYLVMTDHEFPTIGADHVIATGNIQFDVLVEYARSVGIDPVVEGRVRRITDRSLDSAEMASPSSEE